MSIQEHQGEYLLYICRCLRKGYLNSNKLQNARLMETSYIFRLFLSTSVAFRCKLEIRASPPLCIR